MKKEKIVAAIVWLLIATFFLGAIWQWAHPPGLHLGTHLNEAREDWRNTMLTYVVIACALVILRRWLVRKLTRFFLVIAIVLALLAEPILHWWGIPHPEGLWLPYLEGGALVTAIGRYAVQIKSVLMRWFHAVAAKVRP